MIRSYLTVAWRNIVKGKYFSILNIGGLAIGICFTMLIGSFVLHEYLVNKDIKNIDQQYIIQSKWKKDKLGQSFTTFGPLAKALKERYPGLVGNYYRYDGISTIVSKGPNSFRENLQMGDSTFLDMYGISLIYGDKDQALKDPFCVVLTKESAIKYFGRADVLGKSITIENFSSERHAFKVTGVIRTLANNSITNLTKDGKSEFYISKSNLSFFGRNMDWKNRWIPSYIELKKGVTPEDLVGPMKSLIEMNVPDNISTQVQAGLAPLKSYYLSNNDGAGEKLVIALLLIALFILAMTVINFLNMTVARSTSRFKEIGVRKVMGGLKYQIIIQLLLESTLVVFIATFLGIIAFVLTRVIFSQYLGFEMTALSSLPTYFLILPILFVLILGLTAGIYPAIQLAKLNATDAMKKVFHSVRGMTILRNSLISFQFVSAAVAFIMAIIITKQVNLFLDKGLGYNKDLVLTAQVPRDWTKAGQLRMANIGQQLKGIRGVENVSLSYELPSGNSGGQASVYRIQQDSTQAVGAEALQLDSQFPDVYEIPMIAGSYFSQNGQDSANIVLNETTARILGWNDPDNAIGSQVQMTGDPTIFTIKGVLADFSFGSMKNKMSPLVLFDIKTIPIYRYFSFRLNGTDITSTIDHLQSKWRELMPNAPFEYNFMDDELRNIYQSEIRLRKATYLGTSLAFIIVLVGIMGLVSLSIYNRTKEIGVRKILGATSLQIICLFLKEFSGVLVFTILIASPLSYLLMHYWLNGYAYHITISFWPFAISFTVLIFLTTLLIFLRTYKTAKANPVLNMRIE